jgi:hypothetical protein
MGGIALGLVRAALVGHHVPVVVDPTLYEPPDLSHRTWSAIFAWLAALALETLVTLLASLALIASIAFLSMLALRAALAWITSLARFTTFTLDTRITLLAPLPFGPLGTKIAREPDRSWFSLLTLLATLSVEPIFSGLSLVTILAGVALLSWITRVTLFSGNAWLAPFTRLASTTFLSAIALISGLTLGSLLTTLSLFSNRSLFSALSYWAWRSILELGQTCIDPLGQGGILGLKPSDDRARLSLHQFTVALPLIILAIEYLSECYAEHIKKNFFAVVQLAR